MNADAGSDAGSDVGSDAGGPDPGSRSRLFVTSDPHGHRETLTAALRDAGLLTDRNDWAGTDARLFVLGDLLDRGRDGIGVVELMMKLQTQAEQSGGRVVVLLGNHEVLALGMKAFGTTDIDVDGHVRNFAVSWMRNGGQVRDQDLLTDTHLDWLRGLPCMALVDDHLFMHSDTLEYVDWGESVDEVNDAVAETMRASDPAALWRVWSRLTSRYVYTGEDGGYQAESMLYRFGGRLLVHGHSIVGDLLDIDSREIQGPLLYADEQVLAIDGGIYDGGPCLVVELPLSDDNMMRPDPSDDPVSDDA